MNILPTNSIFNIVIFSLLFVILLGFAGLLIAIYSFLSKWIRFLQKEKYSGIDLIKQDAYKKAEKILDAARSESMQLIEDTNIKTKAALESVDSLTEESKTDLEGALHALAAKQEEVLQKTSSDLLTFYKDELSKQKTQSLETLVHAAEDIETEVLHEVEEFKDVLHKETVESQKIVEQKLQEDYKEVEQEIAEFREDQLAKAQESIFDILHDVSIKVFGKALSMEEHQELVLKALEEAKEANIFIA